MFVSSLALTGLTCSARAGELMAFRELVEIFQYEEEKVEATYIKICIS